MTLSLCTVEANIERIVSAINKQFNRPDAVAASLGDQTELMYFVNQLDFQVGQQWILRGSKDKQDIVEILSVTGKQPDETIRHKRVYPSEEYKKIWGKGSSSIACSGRFYFRDFVQVKPLEGV